MLTYIAQKTGLDQYGMFIRLKKDLDREGDYSRLLCWSHHPGDFIDLTLPVRGGPFTYLLVVFKKTRAHERSVQQLAPGGDGSIPVILDVFSFLAVFHDLDYCVY